MSRIKQTLQYKRVTSLHDHVLHNTPPTYVLYIHLTLWLNAVLVCTDSITLKAMLTGELIMLLFVKVLTFSWQWQCNYIFRKSLLNVYKAVVAVQQLVFNNLKRFCESEWIVGTPAAQRISIFSNSFMLRTLFPHWINSWLTGSHSHSLKMKLFRHPLLSIVISAYACLYMCTHTNTHTHWKWEGPRPDNPFTLITTTTITSRDRETVEKVRQSHQQHTCEGDNLKFYLKNSAVESLAENAS